LTDSALTALVHTINYYHLQRNSKSKDAAAAVEERSDFNETVLFVTAGQINPATGCIAVEFDLSDAVTQYAVRADAYTR
jgi:hypothetical protein